MMHFPPGFRPPINPLPGPEELEEIATLVAENRDLRAKNLLLLRQNAGMQRKLSNVVRVLNGLNPLPEKENPTSPLDNT